MAGLVSRYFGFEEGPTDLATEVRAGLTTFMVMAYIIFVNPIILGFTGVPGLDGKGLPFAATLTVTCLAAGVLSIGMGLASNYPFALAAGMGLNAVVAFDLVAGRGLSWPQAMTVVFLEGAIITVLAIVLNEVFAAGQGFATPGAGRIPAAIVQAPDLSTFRPPRLRALREARGRDRDPRDLLDHAQRFLRHDGHDHRCRRPGRLPRHARSAAARQPGAARGLPRGSLRRLREQQQQHHLHRVRRRRDRGRADRARVRGDRTPVPGGDVLLAAGQRHPGPGDGPGADHRRILHDGHRARYSLGRL